MTLHCIALQDKGCTQEPATRVPIKSEPVCRERTDSPLLKVVHERTLGQAVLGTCGLGSFRKAAEVLL